MREAYMVYAKRSPIGRFNGSLSSMRVDDLLAVLLKDLVSWLPFDPLLIDDTLIGCANQAGEDNRNLARMSLLLAGLPFEVPGSTINRLCGSSLDAVLSATTTIKSGFADCLIVGGAESMTRAPYVLSKAISPNARNQKLYDTTIGWRFPNPQMKKLFPLYNMGETALNIAKKFNIPRERQDEFAFNSHQKALKAQKAGAFDQEIIPVTIKRKKDEFIFSKDECPRSDTSLEKLATLSSAFDKDGSVTAGNSASINDGASILLMVSENFLKQHKLSPLVRITGGAVRGVHPDTMGLGPIEATKILCKKFNKKIENFDVVELNEAFAVQALACMDELGLDPDKINLNGGSIALGHPLGCSGARITTTLTHLMKKNKKYKEGLATMCIGVGQGIAISMENCL
ncbi:MAG: acetyl-CoA C-acyltransferase [Halobacteriovoraceae bacterium]|nr:acetyl-CoA C-acyltransferase [Halobacteriovoraceae bacterium]